MEAEIKESKSNSGIDMDNPVSEEDYKADFHKPCIRVGTVAFLCALVLSYLPAMVLSLKYGIMPTGGQIITIMTVIVSASIAWWIVEPISYFPVLGTAGAYMAFLVGGMNVRIPCAIAAQTAANAKAGTQKGEIMATLGIAGSVVTTLLFVTMGAIFGTALLRNLPENVGNMFGYVPVAIYASLLAGLVIKKPGLAVWGILGALLLIHFGVLVIPEYLLLISNVMLCAAAGIYLYRKDKYKNHNN